MTARGDVFQLQEGERLTVRRPAAETGGELLEVEAEWVPASHKPPAHYHPSQDEHFEVLEGEMSAEVDGSMHVLRAGDVLDIPRGARHRMWNSGSVPARATWQVRPAQRTEEFFRTVDELHSSGRVGKDGQLTPLGGGLLLRAFPDEFRLALPGALQRPLAVVLAALARLRGYPRVSGSQ